MMLEILQEMLSILDNMNETIDGMARFPMSSTRGRAERIKELRKKVQYLEASAIEDA